MNEDYGSGDGSGPSQELPRPKLFYIRALDKVIETVIASDRHILSRDDLTTVTAIQSLKDGPRRLLVRLLLREPGQWFRLSRLKYPEIENVEDAALALEAAFLAVQPIDSDYQDVLKSFTMAEFQERFPKKLFRSRSEVDKYWRESKISDGNVSALETLVQSERYLKIVPETYAIVKRISLIYFRFPGVTLKTEIMSTISRWNFACPKDPMRSSMVFPNRRAFILYEEACDLEEQLDTNPTIETFEKAYDLWKQQMADPRLSQGHATGRYHYQQFTSVWVLTRALWHASILLGTLKQHEQEHNFLASLLQQRVFCLGTRGKWYDRLALIQTRHYPPSDRIALETCIRGIEDPYTTISCRMSLQNRIQRLEIKLKVPKGQQRIFVENQKTIKQAPIRRFKARRYQDPQQLLAPHKSRVGQPKPTWYNPQDGVPEKAVGVEQYALNKYGEEGFTGYHCETSIASTIFGLTFWDILCADLPGGGMFETACQLASLDLWTDNFYIARKGAIEKHFDRLKPEMVEERIRQSGPPRKERCIGVNWNRFEADDLISIAKGLGESGLRALCRPLAEDYAHATGGFPDLVIFKTGNSGQVDLKFVEVKGPGDQLSKKQQVWIDALLRGGVDVEVCRVDDVDKNGDGKVNTGSKVKSKKTVKFKGSFRRKR